MNQRSHSHTEFSPLGICPLCEEGSLATKASHHVFTFGEGAEAVELSADVDIHKCVKCGEEFLDDAAQYAMHQAICIHLGVLTPPEIISLRELSGFTRAQFAQLTRIGEASLGRWERGEFIQNPANDQFLYLLTFPDNIDRLKSRSTRATGEVPQIVLTQWAGRWLPVEILPVAAVIDLLESAHLTVSVIQRHQQLEVTLRGSPSSPQTPISLAGEKADGTAAFVSKEKRFDSGEVKFSVASASLCAGDILRISAQVNGNEVPIARLVIP
jgi:YgiT-type zinc finger domain-containing protein